jgi:hypothetical protein
MDGVLFRWRWQVAGFSSRAIPGGPAWQSPGIPEGIERGPYRRWAISANEQRM